MHLDLTQQEADFINDYFQRELSEETLSNFSKTVIINVIQKINNDKNI